MTWRLQLICLTSFFALSACNPFECVKRTGDVQRQVREVGKFEKIVVEDNIELVLTNDSSTQISIEAGANLIGQIGTKLTGTTLLVQNKNRCNWARSAEQPIRVWVGGQALDFIQLMGVGSLVSNEMIQHRRPLFKISSENVAAIRLQMSGSSLDLFTQSSQLITLQGTWQQSKIEVRGFGKVWLEGLQVQQMEAIHNGLNEVRIFPVQRLQASLSNKGNLYLYNEPQELVQMRTGSGNIFRR